MTELAEKDLGPWLSPENLQQVRAQVPMVYVNIIPVRLDHCGEIEAVALLLSGDADKGMARSLVGGRVLINEPIRRAIIRHLEKDLGPMAIPLLPPSIVPFSVVEYLSVPGSAYYDARQHAVAICYIIPIQGECKASEDALDIAWYTKEECWLPEVTDQISEGHALVLQQALTHLGASCGKK